MTKDNMKIVFLTSFIAISARCLWLGFDVASCLALCVSGGMLFGYDWMNSKKEKEAIETEMALLKKQQEELLKLIQNVKSAQNMQSMNVQKPNPPITLNNPFPVRI